MADLNAKPEESPPRSIGAVGLGVAVFNMVVGAGIFLLPATLAREVGAAAPFAYLVCLVAMGGVVLCFAAASSRVSGSGGPYAFVEAGLGPAVGFVVGVMVWLGAVLAAAGIAAAVMDSLRPFLPSLGRPFPRAFGIVLLFVALAAANAAGAVSGARLAVLLTIAKLVPLALLLGVGVLHVNAANLRVAAPDPQAFGRAVLLATFAFQGMEGALGVSGEVRRPERNVPLGLLCAMGAIAILYIAIQVVVQGLLGPRLGASTSPLADAVRVVSPVLGGVLIVGATLSMLGYLAGDMLGAPRVLYAFGRDGFLPAPLARLNGRSRVPAAAIVLHAAIAAALAITGAFVQLAVLSTLAITIVYMTGCVAAVVLQRRRVAHAGPPLRLPGLEAAALVGAAGMAWIASHATRIEALAGSAAIVTSLVWYGAARRIRRTGSRGRRAA